MPYGMGPMTGPMGSANPANAQSMQAAGMAPPGMMPPPQQGMPPQGMPPMGPAGPMPGFDFFKKPVVTPDMQAEAARKLAKALKARGD